MGEEGCDCYQSAIPETAGSNDMDYVTCGLEHQHSIIFYNVVNLVCSSGPLGVFFMC